MAHQQLDAWIDRLAPLFEQQRPPTLLELSGHFDRTRNELLGGCVQALSAELYVHHREQRQMTCSCGRALNRKRVDSKQINTLHGTIALDGAHAPTRSRARRNQKRGPGKWREAKGVRLYLIQDEERIIQIASWHQIQDADAMRQDLHKIAERIPQEMVRTVLLGDGAAWVWNTLEACFPDARQVLDYYHCSEHLYKVAEAHYGETPQAMQWVEATLARLSGEQTSFVIAGLRRMQPTTATAREEINKLATYLQNQRYRLGYDDCEAEGLSIGSGGIESANKFISHVRLKRSSAWWVVENGNGMLRLRCAMYNGTFERVLKNSSSRAGYFWNKPVMLPRNRLYRFELTLAPPYLVGEANTAMPYRSIKNYQ